MTTCKVNIKTAGDPVALSGEAMHLQSSGTTWVITDSAKRVMSANNPRIKVGTAFADSADYTLYPEAGVVVFNANIPAVTAAVKFVGDYLPMGHVGGANKYTLNSESGTEDITSFEDCDEALLAGAIPSKVYAVSADAEVKLTFEKVINVNKALWLKAMIARSTVLAQVTYDDGSAHIGWFIVESDNLASNKVLTRENVNLSLSGELVFVASPVVQLSGSPDLAVAVDAAYSFVATAEGGTQALTYSIVNSPSWASFDVDTGALTGTPVSGDEGNYAAITISATDGTTTGTLPAFTIVVS